MTHTGQAPGENGIHAPGFNSDVNNAFDPDARKAQQDWDIYLSSRPYQDNEGAVHDPITDEPMPASESDREYDNRLYDTSLEDTAGTTKTLTELSAAVKEARARGDTTAASDAEDAFMEKFAAMQQKYGWSPEVVDARLERFGLTMYGANSKQTANLPPNVDTPEASPLDSTSPQATDTKDNSSGPQESSAPAVQDQPQAAPTPSKLRAALEAASKGGSVESSPQAAPDDGATAMDVPVREYGDDMPNAKFYTEVQKEQRARLANENATNGEEGSITQFFNDTQQEEKERQLKETLARIEEEVNSGNLGDIYRTALSQYAELKADSETRGRDSWIKGRTKREKKLQELEDSLIQAKIDLEVEKAERRREEGIYTGSDQEIMARYTNDVFNGVRELDRQTRDATNIVLDERKENRNVAMKAATAVGRFFTSGGKVAQWLKTGGTGLALGAGAAGLGIAISGAGWPITALATAGLKVGVYYGAKTANLDRIRAEENYDEDGRAEQVLDEEVFQKIRQEAQQTNTTGSEQATYLGKQILGRSRKRGYEQADRAITGARKTLGRFALGYAIGGVSTVAGHLLYSAVDHQSVAPGGAGGDGAGGGAGGAHIQGGAPAHSGPATERMANIPSGADHATVGEGWLEGYAHMGLTPEQAQALNSDHNLMEELVKTGDAYRSTNPLIGAYGMRLPASGHLSSAGVNAIRSAIAAHGYNATGFNIEGMNYV